MVFEWNYLDINIISIAFLDCYKNLSRTVFLGNELGTLFFVAFSISTFRVSLFLGGIPEGSFDLHTFGPTIASSTGVT